MGDGGGHTHIVETKGDDLSGRYTANNKIEKQLETRKDDLSNAITASQLDSIIKENTILHNLYGGFGEDIRTFENYSPSIRTSSGGGAIPSVYNQSRIRKLTRLECLRLQGFPDEFYYKCKEEGLSDTQLYKQAGNSMTSDVMYYIIKEILKNGY